MYYVSTTDKFMSGWGLAEGKINKLIFVCDSWDEAARVAQNAKDRTDQTRVKIHTRKPYYSKQTHYVQIKTKADYPSWYEENYFKKQKLAYAKEG